MLDNELVLGDLTWVDIKKCLLKNDSVEWHLSPRVARSRSYLEQKMKTAVIYGVNTGFGKLAQKRISLDSVHTLQKNIVLSHAAGVGSPLPFPVVRLMLLLKLNSLGQGYSGVRLEVLWQLKAFLNLALYPKVPSQGSVGASGDLAPLAHLALPLIGEGEIWYEAHWCRAKTVLDQHGLIPLVLEAKEGLALLNGVQASNAVALYALQILEHLFDWALIASAMSLDAACGSMKPLSHLIHQVRRQPGQMQVASMLESCLIGSEINASHSTCDTTQDPYSLRCTPQILGACLDQIEHAKTICLREANAVSDNPLIFFEEEMIVSGGNFHGQGIAFACDNLALAIAEIGSLSERRLALLMDPSLSDLPPFLVEDSGMQSGFMLAQVTAAALASENKSLSHPRSVDSLPTSANQEDHVSMSMNAALRLLTMLDNLKVILAIELLAGAQGIDFRRPLKSSARIESVYEKIRAVAPFYDHDRQFSIDIDNVQQLMDEPSLGSQFDTFF